ncbi:MAG: hypothetical protein ACLGGX_06775 [Bdellovibrionia bacterium]
MKALVFLLAIGFSLSAQALNLDRIHVGVFNPQWSYLQNSDLNYDVVRANSFFVSAHIQKHILSAQYSESAQDSGNSTLNYKNIYRYVITQYGRNLLNHQFNDSLDFEMHLAGGLGFAQNEVQSRFGGDSSTETGELRLIGLLSLSNYIFIKSGSPDWNFFVGAQGRLQRDTSTSPEVYLVGQFLFGITF